jgi:hypothetical protein
MIRRLLSRREHGICGDRSPALVLPFAPLRPTEVCTLMAGHRGWHHNHQTGMDWTWGK